MVWTWPEASGNGDTVAGYAAAWQKSGTSTWVETFFPGATSTNWTVVGLEPYTSYQLRVRANSSAFPSFGEASYSSATFTADYPAAPLAPTSRSDLGGFSNVTTLWLEWAPPNSYGLPVVEYEVQFINQTAVSTGTAASYLNSDLTPGATFLARVRARNAPSLLAGGTDPAGWGPWGPYGVFRTAEPQAPERPDAPVRTQLTGGASNVTSIAITWPVPASVGLDISTYLVWVDGSDAPRMVSLNYFQLDGLEEGSNHSFSVAAVNGAGTSPRSAVTHLTTATGRCDAPPLRMGPPSRLFLPSIANTTNIFLQWQADGPCPERIREIQLSIDGATLSLPNEADCRNAYYLTNLAPGTSRTIRARARNEFGSFGEWSDNVTFTTAAAAPSKPGAPPTLLLINLTAVELALPLPAPNGESVEEVEAQWLRQDGAVLGAASFASSHWDASAASARVVLPIDDSNVTTSYRYRARNAIGWGEWSEKLVVGQEVTFEPAAPAQPTLVPSSLAPRSFGISFELPTQSASPLAGATFPVDRVELILQPAGQPVSRPPPPPLSPLAVFFTSLLTSALLCSSSAQLTAIQLHSSDLGTLCATAANGPCAYTLSSLEPNTTYSVSLAAYSEGGPSRSSPSLSVQTPPDVPDPVTNVRVTGVSSSEIDVAWTAPAQDNGGGLDSYVVSACSRGVGGAQSCTDTSVLSPMTSAQVSGLPAGQNFTVTVVAENSLGPSVNASADGLFTTWAVPVTPAMPYLGHDLLGLSNTTTIHVRWDAPFENGRPIEKYTLRVDGNELEYAPPPLSCPCPHLHSALFPHLHLLPSPTPPPPAGQVRWQPRLPAVHIRQPVPRHLAQPLGPSHERNRGQRLGRARSVCHGARRAWPPYEHRREAGRSQHAGHRWPRPLLRGRYRHRLRALVS